MKRRYWVLALCVTATAIFLLLRTPVSASFALFVVDRGVPDWDYKAATQICSGKITAASTDEAMRLFQNAAFQGHAKAQRDLGVALWFGVLDKCQVTPHRDKAIAFMFAAASSDDVIAQTLLSTFYSMGTDTLAADYDKSFKWALTAAERGHPLAQRIVGLMFEEGAGTPASHEKALEWYKKAAMQGDQPAQEWLAKHEPTTAQ